MSGQAIKIDPNTNTNNPTQSVLSVTNQPTPTNITQSQIVTGAPTSTQTRTPVPLVVTTLGDASKNLEINPIANMPEGKIVGFNPNTHDPIIVHNDAADLNNALLSVNPSSPFKAVTVTNPDAGAGLITLPGQHTDVHSLGPTNTYQPVDTGGYMDTNALDHQLYQPADPVGSGATNRQLTQSDQGDNTADPGKVFSAQGAGQKTDVDPSERTPDK